LLLNLSFITFGFFFKHSFDIGFVQRILCSSFFFFLKENIFVNFTIIINILTLLFFFYLSIMYLLSFFLSKNFLFHKNRYKSKVMMVIVLRKLEKCLIFASYFFLTLFRQHLFYEPLNLKYPTDFEVPTGFVSFRINYKILEKKIIF